MKRLAALAAATALIAGGWWFVLRIGPRRAMDAAVAAIGVDEAQAYARRSMASGRVLHADLARSWAPSTAAEVEVLPEGRTFYPRMLDDIAASRHSIHIMQYGFQPGVIGDEFAPMLAEKARSGVAVRLILDAVGSAAYRRSRTMLATLAAAGAQVMLHDAIPPDRSGPVGQRRLTLRADQAGRVEHRKMVLVDGRVAYVGGAGIEDHFANGLFHDVYVRVTGPVTHQLQAIFLASLRYHGGSLPNDGRLDKEFPTVDAGEHPVTVLMNWPRGWLPLTDAAEELIRSATRQLDITNPYIGDRRIISAIVDAARREVRVRLIVPDEAHGNGVAYAAFKHHYDALLNAGAEIWEYPALVHAKVIVSDDRALVGTLNLDAWAMYRNPELGLLFDDATVANQVRTVLIEPDIAMSVPGRPTAGAAQRARNRILASASYLY